MNKDCYKIVFNKTRGMRMAVAESAADGGKSGTDGTARRTSSGAMLVTPRPLRFSLWLAFNGLMLAPLHADAQIIADTNAAKTQRAAVIDAANGTSVVNIQAASAAGVSRNLYSRFDVTRRGVILNNARTNAETQLAGWISGNPNLAGGTARVILNEVNGDASQLLGFVEVGGDRAQVVIANPAGITCDGCGFINAQRVTLTTGTPILNGGALEGYRVQGGVIHIAGGGLDTRQSEYTDVIARAVELNAGIWAKALSLTTGANQVNTDNTQATPISSTGTAPAFGIDVAQLGGMYADKIFLVGTEAGVGVRNAGRIAATAGDVCISSEGRLYNSGQISSAMQLRVDTASFDNGSTGNIEANTVDLQVADTLTNRGLINGVDTFINAGTLNNLGTGRIYGDHVAIAATRLNNLAEAGKAPVIAGRSRVDIGTVALDNREHALILSEGDMAIGSGLDADHRALGQAAVVNNASATIESLGDSSISAAVINNTNEHLSTGVQWDEPVPVHAFGDRVDATVGCRPDWDFGRRFRRPFFSRQERIRERICRRSLFGD